MNDASASAASAPVLVIGAGPSGLAAAAQLAARGIGYDHVERHTGVGGLWDIDNPWTPMYESAHFISSRRLSAIPGHPFPDDAADYPPRAEIHAYLRRLAEDTGVADRIRHGVEVVSVTPARGGGFDVVTRPAGGGEETRTRYREVVCATGVLHTPKLPDLPGAEGFAGRYLHSAEYRSIDELRGRRVLVIGAGNSGCDIACDAAQAGASAEISMRRGYWFIPKHILGRPADEWMSGGPELPVKLLQRGAAVALRLLVGDVTKLGLPKPDHLPFESHPLMNDQLIHHLRHGDVRVRGDVERFDADGVVFRDGTRGDYDVVIAATGYRHVVPVAADLFGDRPLEAAYLGMAHRDLPGLWCPGLIETNSGAFDAIGRQAAILAAVVDDRLRGDGRVAAAFEERAQHHRPDLSGGLRMLDLPRHEGYVDSHALQRALAAEVAQTGAVVG